MAIGGSRVRGCRRTGGVRGRGRAPLPESLRDQGSDYPKPLADGRSDGHSNTAGHDRPNPDSSRDRGGDSHAIADDGRHSDSHAHGNHAPKSDTDSGANGTSHAHVGPHAR